MLFWFYIKDHCDHAGFWRANFRDFELITGRRINQVDFLNKINSGKERVKVLLNGRWFITGFIAFHNGERLNLKNHFHQTVYDMFRANLPGEDTITYGFEVFGAKGESHPKKDSDPDERHTIPPSLEMVKCYCEIRKNGIDPQQFIDYYTMRGWKPKGSMRQMTDWQMAVRTWEKYREQRIQSQKKESQQELFTRLECEGRIPKRPQ